MPRLVLDVMAGQDELDSTTIEKTEGTINIRLNTIFGKKIGIIKEYMGEGLEPGVKQVIERPIEKLKKLGAEIRGN